MFPINSPACKPANNQYGSNVASIELHCLSRGNVEHEGRITYLPIYASWCLKDIYGLISTPGDSDKDTGSFSLETIPV